MIILQCGQTPHAQDRSVDSCRLFKQTRVRLCTPLLMEAVMVILCLLRLMPSRVAYPNWGAKKLSMAHERPFEIYGRHVPGQNLQKLLVVHTSSSTPQGRFVVDCKSNLAVRCGRHYLTCIRLCSVQRLVLAAHQSVVKTRGQPPSFDQSGPAAQTTGKD